MNAAAVIARGRRRQLCAARTTNRLELDLNAAARLPSRCRAPTMYTSAVSGLNSLVVEKGGAGVLRAACLCAWTSSAALQARAARRVDVGARAGCARVVAPSPTRCTSLPSHAVVLLVSIPLRDSALPSTFLLLPLICCAPATARRLGRDADTTLHALPRRHREVATAR